MKHSLYASTPRLLIATAIGALCTNAAAQPPLPEQFNTEDPPEVPDVEITGHILKPAALEPTEERLNRLELPAGFEVNVFARDLVNPRMMAVADDGSVYVTRRATGDVIRLVDEDRDGKADVTEIVANRPNMHGIAIDGSTVFLVTVKELYRAEIEDDGSFAPLELLIDDLPDAGQHPNRTITVGPDGMLYLSVGSTCNACDEPNPENATMLRIPPDGSSQTIYASGLRNTIGFGFVPGTEELYGMDHGIDWLGDNVQHEELNHILEGHHYGWPYIYDDGQYNPADEPPGELTWQDWEAQSTEPIGFYTPHAAPMQMKFYTGDAFPEQFHGDAFVAMRGSWNRKPPSGYEVVRIDFEGGQPRGFEPFMTGVLMEENESWGHLGRLAGVAQAQDGALLVSDDENGVIYRISYTGENEDQAANLEPTNPEGANIRMNGNSASSDSPTSADQLAIASLQNGSVVDLAPETPVFDDGQPIPEKYAAEQENISPALQWEQGPEETKSYAIIVQDPDAPQASPFVHWVLYNVPAETTRLDQGVPQKPFLEKPENALQGQNDRGSMGYFGPRPPEGDPAHHYHFQVFALDTELDLQFGATAGELIQAMQGHVVGAGEVVGTYQR